MPNPRSKSTATKENALTAAERDELLAVRQDARLGTNRDDGWWHITPIWYVWEDGCFRHTLGAGRRHLRNLRSDPHATICVAATACRPEREPWSASARRSSRPTKA